MRQKFVAGNWKMHGNLKAMLHCSRGQVGRRRTLLPRRGFPCPSLSGAGQASLEGSALVAWGRRRLVNSLQGPIPEEVAGPMLVDFGARYAIVGHSERRAIYGEVTRPSRPNSLLHADRRPGTHSLCRRDPCRTGGRAHRRGRAAAADGGGG